MITEKELQQPYNIKLLPLRRVFGMMTPSEARRTIKMMHEIYVQLKKEGYYKHGHHRSSRRSRD